MATTKKTPAKKVAPKKAQPKKSAKKSTAKFTKQQEAEFKSFHMSRNQPFFSTHITRQTVYWSILLIVILITQIWILNVQLDVIKVLDSINSTL